MSTATSVGRDLFKTVEVYDPNGQRSVLLEGLRGSATVGEIRARAIGELRLPAVAWNLRQAEDIHCREHDEEDELTDLRRRTEKCYQILLDQGVHRVLSRPAYPSFLLFLPCRFFRRCLAFRRG